MLRETERWLATRSWSVTDRPLHRILAAKRATNQSVSVVLPALNEEETVGDIVAVIRHDLMHQVPLVDEIVVVDSGSTDRTSEVAAAAGARVVHRDDILPRIPAVPGKGEVLWRSLLVTTGDIVCFIDADLRSSPRTSSRGSSARCSPTPGWIWSRACTTVRWAARPVRAAGSPS